MKAQKKPIVIDYLPYYGSIEAVIGWVKSLDDPFYKWFDIQPKGVGFDDSLFVKTLEGTSYEVTTDDVIIRGVNHEYYPCKKDIFHKTYDLL